MTLRRFASRYLPLTAGLLFVAAPLGGQGLSYPNTTKVTQVDGYFGTEVSDPYRWLEDDTASAVKRWVEAQNAVTSGYLDKIPFRAQLRARLEQLYNYPRYSTPSAARTLVPLHPEHRPPESAGALRPNGDQTERRRS